MEELGEEEAAGEVITAYYDHAAEEDGELSFLEGDRIGVLEKHDDAWWEGHCLRTGEKGIFPVNYTDAGE